MVARLLRCCCGRYLLRADVRLERPVCAFIVITLVGFLVWGSLLSVLVLHPVFASVFLLACVLLGNSILNQPPWEDSHNASRCFLWWCAPVHHKASSWGDDRGGGGVSLETLAQRMEKMEHQLEQVLVYAKSSAPGRPSSPMSRVTSLQSPRRRSSRGPVHKAEKRLFSTPEDHRADKGTHFGSEGKGGGKGGGRSAPKAPPKHVAPPGTQVAIHSLSKAPEHNGKLGRITGWNHETGRYEVSVENETMSFKPSNVVQSCTVEIVGIESQPELNGQFGDILGYTASNERYTIKLKSDGRAFGASRKNVIINQGTRVTLVDLSSTQHNGLMGQIVEIDRDAQRYTISAQNNQQLKIKFENVLC